jgi:hypothetical protein
MSNSQNKKKRICDADRNHNDFEKAATVDNDDFEKSAERLAAEEKRIEQKMKKVKEINDKRNIIIEEIEKYLIGYVWNDVEVRKKLGEGLGVEFGTADLSVTILGERFYLEFRSEKERD